jgi:leader peptidase (prepilin peptidase)/N-methyltransferase
MSGIGLLGVFGAAIGSFLNVVAYRMPRRESLVFPRSRCSSCEAEIAPYDNIPVVSWLLLRGRCRNCGVRISVRYPLIEALTAGLFVVVGLEFGTEPELIPALVFTAVMIAVAAIDLEHKIIPNRITAPAAVAAVALWAVIDPSVLPENLIAGAAAGAGMLIVAIAYPAGMGMGDVKLAGVMGLYLGKSVAPALFVGFAAGAIVGIGIVAVRGAAARKQGVPFGPFLALGGIVGLLVGPEIIDWYASVSGL